MAILFVLLAASRIVVTEVMANPAGGTGAHGPEDRNEFVELYNAGHDAVDLAGWTIDDGDGVDELVAWQDSSVLAGNAALVVNYTWLNPGSYAVVLDSEYTDPNPAGGFVRPYRFAPGTLILTVGNTTIGNGLATTDPVTLFPSSAYDDTSSFGTPQDSADSLPCDPGDGISWERIRLDRPDTLDNWVVCLDSAGCTPGAANSITSFLDLAVTALSLADSVVPAAPITSSVRVANTGCVLTADWSLLLFLDKNGNGAVSPTEEIGRWAGRPLPPDEESVFTVTFTCPRRQTDLWAEVVCAGDRDTLNNRRRLTLDPGGSDRLLSLELSSFSPDGDGFEDTLIVRYRVPATGGTMTVTVFDLAGRSVATLASREKITDERGFYAWDGRRRDSRPAANGVYAAWLEYRVNGITSREQLRLVLFRR